MEEFALSLDRAKALEPLIPGTEDHDYYHCLQHQHEGRFGEVEKILKLWRQRHGKTARFQEIVNRQALLAFDRDPKASLEHLRRELGPFLSHQREVEGAVTDFPSILDPAPIAREAFKAQALERSSGVDEFTDEGLECLLPGDLDDDRRRALLERVTRPDFPNLVELILKDLDYEYSGGFGTLEIHRQILPGQLDALARKRPSLQGEEAFVAARIAKLHPGPEADVTGDADDRRAYLEALWGAVRSLPPAFNSLKAHVLYHILDLDRRQGNYDLALFLQYVLIPRHAPYAEPEYARRRELRDFIADLNRDFSSLTLLETIRDDEPLVRDTLEHAFSDSDSIEPFKAAIRAGYLTRVLAETRILAGKGDMEKWISLLDDPGHLQALKDRVDIQFAPTNPVRLASREEVRLEVDVKNVPKLLVKVFEINTRNHFLARGCEADTSLDLDGLVAGEEHVFEYDEPPLRRVRRRFSFPSLDRPGVFVVELIGGGKSSRALIRKGGLRVLERVGAAGHVFTVLDEDDRVLPDARLLLEGREFAPGEHGTITVPFTARPGPQKILLTHGGRASVAAFHHLAETYAFSAGLWVDRENLLKRRQARLLVRPRLTVHGNPVSLSLVENPRLVLETTDRAGVSSSKDVPAFALAADKESEFVFQVPEDLDAITFTVTGEVRAVTRDEKIPVRDARTIRLNRIDGTDAVDDLHLGHSAEGYALHVLGKSGEARPDKPVHFAFRHRDFTFEIEQTLQTDAAGRIALGALEGIVELTATGPSGESRMWRPTPDACQLPKRIHARAGDPVLVPFTGTPLLEARGPRSRKKGKARAKGAERPWSLLEVRGGVCVSDRNDAVTEADGFLRIETLAPGDYRLHLKDANHSMEICVASGPVHRDWVLGRHRHLEVLNPKPLHIIRAEESNQGIRLALAHAGPGARVHAAAVRFVPALSLFADLRLRSLREPRAAGTTRARSEYVSGRDIGDEYRYILERKNAVRFPGNLLTRPGLLLNPWAVRKTETGQDEARPGTAYGRSASAPCMPCADAPMESEWDDEDAAAHANLDFLAHPSVVTANLVPEKDGSVLLASSWLAHADEVHVLAVDGSNTAYRRIPLKACGTPHQDLRLRLGLDPEKHFTEKKQVSVLPEGGSLEIADITTSALETYDTLGRVFALYATLSGDATWSEFSFILNWPHLEEEEKRRLYGEYACHELHFFVSRKDPAWFEAVVKPYLRHKKDKTFLDRYLVEEDLSGYLNPWAFSRLNAVERILLCKRLAGEWEAGRRHVEDLCELLPVDLDLLNRLFDTALKGGALDTEDALGFAEASALAMEDRLVQAMQLAPMSAGAGGMPSPRRSRAEKAKRRGRDDDMRSMKSEAYDEEICAESFDDESADLAEREEQRPFYRKLDKTQEWAENNYYKRTMADQGPALVAVNLFWRDFARHDGTGPFLSPHLASAANGFTEMMLALSVLDLPFETGKAKATFEGERMRLSAASPAVVYHKEIKPSLPAAEKVPVLVSQNYFRADDRYRYEGAETLDKYVTDEFLVHTVYLCQVVLTNPTSSAQKLDLLLQIPIGALPVRDGFVTRGVHVRLESYATHSLEYAFYFPAEGTMPHYPVHVAKDEELLVAAPPTALKVVLKPSRRDTASWAWISQNGKPGEVLAFLEANNADRLELEKIAWRMDDPTFFRKTLDLLAARKVYCHALWAYALKHGSPADLREYLNHEEGFLRRCGPWLECAILRLDPVERGWYEHLEYAPLVNARAHALKGRHTILNDRFAEQFRRFLDLMCHKPNRSDADWLAAATYLFLQDRVEEALEIFARANPKRLHTRLQHDYLAAYAAFYRERPDEARAAAAPWADLPVDRWRKLFDLVLAHLDEAEGKAVASVDDTDRAQRQERLADTEPDLDVKVENRVVTLRARNLRTVRVNYTLMDIELLFSRQPFVQQRSDQFGFVTPNRSDVVEWPAGEDTIAFDLPQEFRRANLVVEVLGAGIRKSQDYYAHELIVQIVETYGHVRVARAGDGKPLPRAYVKVFARMEGGAVRFYKDGYTDLRGRFDYVSLNTDELDRVERFALLIMTGDLGAVIQEASPPKR